MSVINQITVGGKAYDINDSRVAAILERITALESQPSQPKYKHTVCISARAVSGEGMWSSIKFTYVSDSATPLTSLEDIYTSVPNADSIETDRQNSVMQGTATNERTCPIVEISVSLTAIEVTYIDGIVDGAEITQEYYFGFDSDSLEEGAEITISDEVDAV